MSISDRAKYAADLLDGFDLHILKLVVHTRRVAVASSFAELARAFLAVMMTWLLV